LQETGFELKMAFGGKGQSEQSNWPGNRIGVECAGQKSDLVPWL
jgi:hypothetical protein